MQIMMKNHSSSPCLILLGSLSKEGLGQENWMKEGVIAMCLRNHSRNLGTEDYCCSFMLFYIS
jgi:hypothetical protein